MCECQKNNIGNSNTIADAFNRNQLPVAKVFMKYNMGHMPVSFQSAQLGTAAYGPNYAREIAEAAAGVSPDMNMNYFTAAESQGLASTIMSGLSGLSSGVGDLLGGVGALKAGQQGAAPTYNILQPGATAQPQYAPQYIPQPQQPATTGMSTTQIVLIAATALLVIGAIAFAVWKSNKN